MNFIYENMMIKKHTMRYDREKIGEFPFLNKIQETEVRIFGRRLKLWTFPGIDMACCANLACFHSNMYIAMDKFSALDMQIKIGAQSLMMAYKKDQETVFGMKSLSPLWQRSMHFQNALNAYNNCYDYIGQILFFWKMVTHEEILQMTTYEDVEAKSQKVSSRTVQECLMAFKEKFPDSKEMIDNLIEKRKHINHMTILLKHRGSFWIYGNHIQTFGSLSKPYNGEEKNLSRILTPPTIDIEKEIEYLVEYNNILYAIQDILWKSLNLNNPWKMETIK